MKKFLLVALMVVLSLTVATDTFGGRYKRYWGDGYGYGGGCGSNSCSPCQPEPQCPPPPCCECEQTITVRVPPQLVCGWVCPDGTNTIPTSEARLVND